MSNKPTTKIIQISANQYSLFALCEDGSLWEKDVNIWSSEWKKLVASDAS